MEIGGSLFSGIMLGHCAKLQKMIADEKQDQWSIIFYDERGQDIGYAIINYSTTCITLRQMHLDYKYRGNKYGKKFIDKCLKLVPTVKLLAFTGSGTQGEQYGAYVWAKYGFHYIDDAERLKLHGKFKEWLSSKESLKKIDLAKFIIRIDSWSYPCQLATSMIEDIEVGKLFLIDLCEAPSWSGILHRV